LTLYGIQRRNVTCRHVCETESTSSSSTSSLKTPSDACLLTSGGSPPATERLCRLPCPQDCVVTELGPWSPCCGGLQTRQRRVLVGPQHGGRACQAPLLDSRRCNDDDNNGNNKDNNNNNQEACGVLTTLTVRRRPIYLVGRCSHYILKSICSW